MVNKKQLKREIYKEIKNFIALYSFGILCILIYGVLIYNRYSLHVVNLEFMPYLLGSLFLHMVLGVGTYTLWRVLHE